MDVIPAIDVRGGRSRVVYWPGASAGIGAPTDRPERIAEQFVAQGARIIHLVDFDGAQQARPANLEAVGAVASRVAVPLQLAGGLEEADHVRLAFAAGATRVVLSLAIVERPDALRACLAVAGDWLAVGLDPRPERLAAFPWRRAAARRSTRWSRSSSARGVRRLVLSPRRHGARRRPRRALAAVTTPTSSSRAAPPTSTASAACATRASPASSSARRSSPVPSTSPCALEAAA